MKKLLGILIISLCFNTAIKAQATYPITLKSMETVIQPVGKTIKIKKDKKGKILSPYHNFTSKDSLKIGVVIAHQIDSTSSSDSLVVKVGTGSSKKDLFFKTVPFVNSKSLYVQLDYCRLEINRCRFNGTIYVEAEVVNKGTAKSNKILKTIKLK